ncbi:MAG TPA: acetyl-CoA carboxylase biotin carboxyl carrier protein, partial [Pyrinomonadaceae bacterium]
RHGAATEKTMNDDSPDAAQGVANAEVTESSSRKATRTRRQPRQEGSVNMDELRELIALIRENGLAEFELEQHGFRVRLRREETYRRDETGVELNSTPLELPQARPVVRNPGVAGAAAASLPAHPGAQAETAASEDQDLHIITSPIVGTFYRAPSPTAESFVKIGSNVEPETVVCIIEAMKLMNEIQAETTGEVAKIYVENGQPVEYGQPLFGLKK